ncbi:MAG: cyclase family protein [Bacteroidales bacterium]|nr:cyclase family protein [Bacteroidales bacterium]
MNPIDLTLRVDLRSANEAQANLDKARSGHLGTHFDVMAKEFPLEYMEREAIVFDVSAIGTSREIGIGDIDLEAVPEQGFVAFYTRYIEQVAYGTKEYFKSHPCLSMNLIEALLGRHVAIIAIDFAGVRNGKEHTPTDQLCADRGTFIVENVCNLAAVLNGKKMARFAAGTYPVNYVGTTGLPCRVVAREVK